MKQDMLMIGDKVCIKLNTEIYNCFAKTFVGFEWKNEFEVLGEGSVYNRILVKNLHGLMCGTPMELFLDELEKL